MQKYKYDYIAPLVKEGKTDAEIADLVRPLPVTERPISLGILQWFLREQGLYRRLPPFGSLDLLLADDETPKALREELACFLSRVYGPSDLEGHDDRPLPYKYKLNNSGMCIDTTELETAERLSKLLSDLIQIGVLTEDQRTLLYEFGGGGLAFAGFTEVDVACSRRKRIMTTAIESAWSAFNQGLDKTEILARFSAELGSW